jgi:cyclopropane fatty-acyl-phospholipid synthase-like methyltransferase
VSTHLDEIRFYYDVNTADFQRYGQGSEQAVIRRAVWGPGVTQRTAAFRYVDELIAAELGALQKSVPLRVLDFGCGLGASLLHLWQALQVQGVGFTISPIQAQLARQRFAAADASQHLTCLEADFLSLAQDLPAADAVFAIESFVHSTSAHAFFEAAARHLKPGGTLIVCDDFLTPRTQSALRPAERQAIDTFRHGWVAPTVIPVQEAIHAAAHCGLELHTDLNLTCYLELQRPRDRALSALVSLLGQLPIPGYRWRSLVGGNALRTALRTGLVEHRYLSWRKKIHMEAVRQ